jgi:hypothetical protein
MHILSHTPLLLWTYFPNLQNLEIVIYPVINAIDSTSPYNEYINTYFKDYCPDQEQMMKLRQQSLTKMPTFKHRGKWLEAQVQTWFKEMVDAHQLTWKAPEIWTTLRWRNNMLPYQILSEDGVELFSGTSPAEFEDTLRGEHVKSLSIEGCDYYNILVIPAHDERWYDDCKRIFSRLDHFADPVITRCWFRSRYGNVARVMAEQRNAYRESLQLYISSDSPSEDDGTSSEDSSEGAV